MRKLIIGIIVVCVIVMIGLFIAGNNSQNTTQTVQTTTTETTIVKTETATETKDNVFNKVSILYNVNKKEAKDLYVDLTINNTSNAAITNLEITCRNFYDDGKSVDVVVNKTDESVSAKETKQINQFNMGALSHPPSVVSCELTDFKIVE